MRVRLILKLHRILWVGNFVLLAILVYVIACFFFRNDAGQEPPVDAKSKIKEKVVDLGKNSPPAANQAIILQKNIFGKGETGTFKNHTEQEQVGSIPVVREQFKFRLVGTVSGNEAIACAVVENIETKAQHLYKTGDVIQGATIERIEPNRIILLRGEQRELLNLYVASVDSAPIEKRTKSPVATKSSFAKAVNIVSPTEREIDTRAFLAKTGPMENILKTVQVSPHIVNGESKGLRITGLEASGVAKYAGFENGDIIQTINGQEVSDRRNAFQALRKARAMSCLDTQFLRGEETKKLSFIMQ